MELKIPKKKKKEKIGRYRGFSRMTKWILKKTATASRERRRRYIAVVGRRSTILSRQPTVCMRAQRSQIKERQSRRDGVAIALHKTSLAGCASRRVAATL